MTTEIDYLHNAGILPEEVLACIEPFPQQPVEEPHHTLQAAAYGNQSDCRRELQRSPDSSFTRETESRARTNTPNAPRGEISHINLTHQTHGLVHSPGPAGIQEETEDDITDLKQYESS